MEQVIEILRQDNNEYQIKCSCGWVSMRCQYSHTVSILLESHFTRHRNKGEMR